tara:strand:+ start:6955 stop:7440 length:486 start_codon:yes stop_codon:yes gene_type:complete
MAETLHISGETKQEMYTTLNSQIDALTSGETNLIANLANVASALKMTFNPLWVGFYLLENDSLVLGPFQGPIACTRIKKGRGVCGTAWEQNQTILVQNVNEFAGHIACSSESVSEIVVPLHNSNNEFIGVLDIDSVNEGEFDETDQKHLEDLLKIISKTIH